MVFRNSPAQDYVQSDYSNAGRFKANGSAQEQKFIENLIWDWFMAGRMVGK